MTKEGLFKIAEETIENIVIKLPMELREKAALIPVVFEEKPNRGLVKDGIEADTMGLFVGPPFADGVFATDTLPSQIILFVMNIYDEADKAVPEFRRQVRITYLHELGHYLGLDEEDLYDRELD